MRKRWQIACYQNENGHQPVVDYITDLTSVDDLGLIFHVIQRLSRVGLDLVDTKMAKRLDGRIFELRKDRHRIMFAEDIKKDRFILLSAFLKRTENTPTEEIIKVNAYLSDYMRTGKCEVFAVPFDEM